MIKEPFHLTGLINKHMITLYVAEALRAAGYRNTKVDKYYERVRTMDYDQTLKYSQEVIDNINEGLNLK